jgi:hypothetical protein
LKPPVHFSNSTLQRGTTHQFCAGVVLGKAEVGHACPGPAELGEPTAKRSITTALDMKNSFLLDRPDAVGNGPKRDASNDPNAESGHGTRRPSE